MAKRVPPELDPIRRRIVDRAREMGTNLKALSKQLGKNESYIHTFVSKGSPVELDGDDRRALAEMLGLPEMALRPGAKVIDQSHLATIETVRGVHFARIPAHDIRAAAGTGVAAEDYSEPIGWRLFETSWLKSVTHSKLDKLIVIQVAGDSMSDTLANGDHVLVDLGRRTLAQPGIFVLRLDGELIVKRVQKSFGTGAVTLISDNDRYPQETIDAPDRLDVIGRVVWLGRSVG